MAADEDTCPASISGNCLQVTEDLTPCPGECERAIWDAWAAEQRANALTRPAPRRARRLPTTGRIPGEA